MHRRDFIKNSILCTGALCLGCKSAEAKKDNFELPEMVQIETCTLCQLSCPECWRNKEPDKIPLGYLKFEDFKTFIDNNSFIKKIELANNGEIFLNPDLNKIINYAYEKNIKLVAQAGVNLNYIPDKTAELLVKTKFEDINISIDGASQETYSIYRRGGNFNKVIDNIKKIQYYQKKYNDFEHPKMVWKFIPFGHNEHEIPKAKQMAEELGIPIRFDVNYAPEYSPLKDVKFVETETGLNFGDNNIGYERNFFRMFYERYQKNGEWFYCTAFFDRPNIFFDGTFKGCCLGYNNKVPKINVFKTGLKQAIQNRKIKNVIEVFVLNKDSKGSMCENCDVLKFLKENNIKLTKDNHLKLQEKLRNNTNG